MFSKSFRQYALCSKSHKRFIVQVHLCLWSVHKYHNIYIQYHNTKIQYHNTNTTIPLTGHNAIPHIHIQYHNTTHTHTISQYYIYIHMQYQYHNTTIPEGPLALVSSQNIFSSPRRLLVVRKQADRKW